LFGKKKKRGKEKEKEKRMNSDRVTNLKFPADSRPSGTFSCTLMTTMHSLSDKSYE
jgi:hypothetical protein